MNSHAVYIYMVLFLIYLSWLFSTNILADSKYMEYALMKILYSLLKIIYKLTFLLLLELIFSLLICFMMQIYYFGRHDGNVA
jgi:hypothetical protein